MDILKTIICFLCLCIYFFVNNDAAHALKKRFVGGRNATSEEAKAYVAYLNDVVVCGGAIIDEKLILTSASCIGINKSSGRLHKRSFIIAGAPDVENRGSNNKFDVARAYIPSSYETSSGLAFDKDNIAILELKENLRLDENLDTLKKLELPQFVDDANYQYENAPVIAGGFGFRNLTRSKYESGDREGDDKFEGFDPYLLQVGKSRIVDNEKCKTMGYGSIVKDSHICVTVTQNLTHAGPCRGDVGSPLIFDNKIIIGVLSAFDESCDTDAYPAIYTRVSSYLEFIENVKDGNTIDITIFEA